MINKSSLIVSALSVTKSFQLGDFEIKALDGVDFEVRRGDFTAVSGTSGSGKTTLLNLIGCLDLPSSGSIQIGESKTNAMTSRELAHLRREKIGFIFQTFNLLPVLSALENVEYPLQIAGVRGDQRRARAEKALEHVGLKDYFLRRPDQLSGGQRQRVAIARALVKNPMLILADEPTANLDHETAKGVLELMKKLNEEQNVTFVFSSHDPLVLNLTKKTVMLQNGKRVN